MSTIPFRNWSLYHIITESNSCLAEYVGASLLCNKLADDGGMKNQHNNILIDYFNIKAQIQGDVSNNVLKSYEQQTKDYKNALSLLFPTASKVAEAMLQVYYFFKFLYLC